MRIRHLIVGLGALLVAQVGALLPATAAPYPTIAQDVGVCDPYYPLRCIKPNVDGSVNITGSVTAGAAFAPTGQASLAVTTTSGRVALPAASANVTLVNSGAQTAYFLLGNSSVAATTATGYPLQAGSSITVAVGSNTHVAAITSTSTATLGVTSGTGVPALAGGGSVSASGSSTVTATAAAPTYTEGSSANPVSSDLHGGARMLPMTPLGAAIDLTTPSGILGVDGATITTLANPFPTTAGLVAGTAIAGKFGIDQTTDGTTNRVNAVLASATTGGCTPVGVISTASTNAGFVKASAGTWCGGVAINTTATLAYLRFYNLTSAPTCSSATGYVTTIPVPASTSGAGTPLNFGTYGAAFTTGIAYCITGGGSSTDNTNAPAGVYIAASYK